MIDCERIEDVSVEETERESEEFAVTSDHEANWAVKKIKELTAENDRIVQIAKDDIAELQTKIELLNTQLAGRVGFLKSKLYEYFQTVEHKETKTQESYKLLDGSLAYKKPSVKIVRPADEELVKLMESNDAGEYVEVVKKPKWADWKKTLTIADNDGKVVVDANGVAIEGLKTEETTGEFLIK